MVYATLGTAVSDRRAAAAGGRTAEGGCGTAAGRRCRLARQRPDSERQLQPPVPTASAWLRDTTATAGREGDGHWRRLMQ